MWPPDSLRGLAKACLVPGEPQYPLQIRADGQWALMEPDSWLGVGRNIVRVPRPDVRSCRVWSVWSCARCGRSGAGMTSFDELLGAAPGAKAARGDVLRLATLAYLARYKGDSRMHTESDLRIYLTWCTERHLEPLAVRRAHVEMYVRWLQEVRRFRPSTVFRRLSVVAGFYRTCVIDGILEHSPADHVRRPNVPPESPTLGLSHLQFEALLSAARASANPNDFALVAMLGLLGLRIFEANGADIGDLDEEHGHRVLRMIGKGTRTVLIPLPPAVGRAIDRAIGDRTVGAYPPQHPRGSDGSARRHSSPAPTGGRIRCPVAADAPAHAAAHLRDHHARRQRRPARGTDRRTPRRPTHHHALRPSPQQPRPPPQLHPRRPHGLRHLSRGPRPEHAGPFVASSVD